MRVTQAWIDAHRTARGAWTRQQLEALGVGWPLPPRWRDRVDGKEISDEDAATFERSTKTMKEQRLERRMEGDMFGMNEAESTC